MGALFRSALSRRDERRDGRPADRRRPLLRHGLRPGRHRICDRISPLRDSAGPPSLGRTPADGVGSYAARPRKRFYFDAAIDALFVRPAQLLGRIFGGIVDPLVLDGAVRELVVIAVAFGNRFRTLQMGLLRGYALTIVIGVVCVIAYYAVVGASR